MSDEITADTEPVTVTTSARDGSEVVLTVDANTSIDLAELYFAPAPEEPAEAPIEQVDDHGDGGLDEALHPVDPAPVDSAPVPDDMPSSFPIDPPADNTPADQPQEPVQ